MKNGYFYQGSEYLVVDVSEEKNHHRFILKDKRFNNYIIISERKVKQQQYRHGLAALKEV